MFYQERKTIVILITGLIIIGAYVFYFLQELHGRPDLIQDGVFWAKTMLIFIGIGIVVNIVIMIVFHILNAIVNEVTRQEQDDPSIEDEMDKLIDLKSTRNSYVVVGIGFVWSLFSLVFQQPLGIVLNIVFFSFFVGSVFESISRLYFYRKGV